MKLKTINATGSKSSMTASDKVFAAKVNQFLLAQAVRVYTANAHQGTSVAQTRSEVTRTKKKWFKQKGTGNARHGARTSNIFVGGGAAHGPRLEQQLSLSLSKKQKKQALISALSLRAKDILICDALANLKGKSKAAQDLLNKLDPKIKRAVIVLDKISDEVWKSLRNLAAVEVIESRRLNALDVLDAQEIFMDQAAIKTLEIRLLSSKDVAAQHLEETKPKAKKVIKK